jgi:hypothetical protein
VCVRARACVRECVCVCVRECACVCVCILFAGKEGAMKRCVDGRWAHAACSFFTPGVLIEAGGVCGINKVSASSWLKESKP